MSQETHKQGLCINLEGWKGREMGGGFKRERYMYTYGEV